MSKEIELFSKDRLKISQKFYKLMDIFLSRNNNIYEVLILYTIYYLQFISLFFSEQIHIFDKNSKFDEILIYIHKIIRIKDLFRKFYYQMEIFIYIIFSIMIICIVIFFIICCKTTFNSIFSFNKLFIHTMIKIFIFFEFNAILDCCFSVYCFGFSEDNPNFTSGIKCGGNNKISIKIISILFIIISIILKYLFQIFYSDIFIFSSSCSTKISCHYDLYMDINGIFNSIFTIQAFYINKEIFLLFNFFYSIILLFYYLRYYLFYNSYMHILAGIFHILYAWTSVFSLIFNYINIKEKGIVYIISSIIICIYFINLKNKREKDLFYNNSLFNLTNLHKSLHFINIFNEKLLKYNESRENNAFLTGLIEILVSEKSKVKIYKYINEEKNEELEKKLTLLFKGAMNEPNLRKYILETLLNLLVLIFHDKPDIYLNISLFYLLYIRNYCQSMYYFQKLSFLKLSFLEQFAYKRLKLHINEIIKQNLIPFSEQSYIGLENVDISLYFKYDYLSHNFCEEISKEIELTLDFWKEFKKYSLVKNYIIDYNKVFELTDKIKTTEGKVEKMWSDLLRLYKGVNEYFYFYNEYIEQIIDDNRKKKDLDSLRRKNDTMRENINSNFYMILFSKDTGIIIANADKGSEGIIMHCNKRISNIFNYKLSELKDENVTKLMPKLFATEHSKYIENYFRRGTKKYIEKEDFKTFAKDKYNSIVQIRLGLKLFPILNYNVFLAGIIIKENMDDMIILDKDFNIQGVSLKLSKIFNLNDDSFFQNHQIPFYAFCKKFINFYNMFIKNKSAEKNQDLFEQINNIDNNKMKDYEEKESPKAKEKENKENYKEKENQKIEEAVDKNIEVNENIELEFEIKIPQFIIDFSKISKNNRFKRSELQDQEGEEEDDKNHHYNIFESSFSEEEEENENLPFLHEKGTILKKTGKHKKGRKLSYEGRLKSTKIGDTPLTPTPTEDDDDYVEKLKSRILNERERMAHCSNEEKIFIDVINEYKTLFRDGKFNDLEDLIDLYNKKSSFTEYKFNFGFDKIKFGNNEILYIVRCIDNQMDENISTDKSFGEQNPSSVKYRKEKMEAIKPLFELLKEEEEEIKKSYESFLKLSLENIKFKELLEQAKKDIDNLSKIHGQKKEEIIEDENSSQTSQTGFDSGLVQKNKIEEIKAKLFNNSNNFPTIKYIRLVMILLIIFTIVFAFVYSLKILQIKNTLTDISIMNLYLFQSSFLTSQMISIFISLKLFLDIKMKHINFLVDINNSDENDLINFTQYDQDMHSVVKQLYNSITFYLGQLEIGIGEFLSKEELKSFYWDKINISYVSYLKTNESYPIAMDQFLCNCERFLKINDTEEYLINIISQNNDFESFFNYTTYLIIENGYNSILPEQFKKLSKVVYIFSEYNESKKGILLGAIGLFSGCCLLDLIFFNILIRITNSAMTELYKKLSKIKLDKIEERIKKLETFDSNLNEFREKDNNEFIEESKTKSDNHNSNNTKIKLMHIKALKTETSIGDNSRKNSNTNIADVSSFSNGYSLEDKKYISLSVLNEYFIHTFIIVIFFAVFLVLIYLYSIQMIKDINTLLNIEKFFYGKLIATSTQIIEMKCHLSDCNNKTLLDYQEFRSYSNIDEIIKGIKIFDEIDDYYNNKILLDTCKAIEDDNSDNETIALCINDKIVESGNNTYNLMKIIENTINNIYNTDSMESNKSSSYKKIVLFKSEEYQLIEHIYYFYISKLNNILSKVIKSNLISYLQSKKNIIIISVACLIVFQFLYFIIFMEIYIPRLVHFISVTRSVMKVIPTSIIMITQELEKWIESKANSNFSF